MPDGEVTFLIGALRDGLVHVEVESDAYRFGMNLTPKAAVMLARRLTTQATIALALDDFQSAGARLMAPVNG